MQPHKYIGVVVIMLGVLIAGWLGVVIAIAGTPTVSSNSLCAMLAEKRRIASEFDTKVIGRRLFIVSGSSAHFGISAVDIETAFGLPTINFGSHAGLSFSVILSDVKQLVRPGDVVLLVPEYERYSRRGLNNVIIDYLFACAVDTLRELPWKKQLEAAFSMSVSRVGAGIAAKLALPSLAEKLAYINLPLQKGEKYSDRVLLGPRGDAIINERAAITPIYRQRIAQAAASSIIFDAGSDDVQAITSFVEWAVKRRVRVIATWPNTVNFPAYQTPAATAFFNRIRDYYRVSGVKLLGTPDAVLLQADDFFDHHYHLHRDAVARRSVALIQLLREELTGTPK